MKIQTKAPLLSALCATLLASGAQADTVLLFDDFTHATDTGYIGLDGETSGGTLSAVWEATNNEPTTAPKQAMVSKLGECYISGGTQGQSGSATLAFTPQQGKVYQLDATFSGLTGADWVGFGFANGQNDNYHAYNNRFLGTLTYGRNWMYVNGAGTGGQTFIGNAADNGAPWTLPLPTSGDKTIDLRIVLDTTGGTGNWITTWFAKRPVDSSYTPLRTVDPAPVAAEGITSVGFCMTAKNNNISCTIESITLTEVAGGTTLPPAITSISVSGNTATLTMTGDDSVDYYCASSVNLAGFTTEETPLVTGTATPLGSPFNTSSGGLTFDVNITGRTDKLFFRVQDTDPNP